MGKGEGALKVCCYSILESLLTRSFSSRSYAGALRVPMPHQRTEDHREKHPRHKIY